MLSQQELNEVIRGLPRVLEHDPQFVAFIKGIVNDKFQEQVLDEFTLIRKDIGGLRADMNQRFDSMIQEMRDLRDWVELIAGRLQNRTGRNLENIVAGALRLGLSRPDIEAVNIKMRQKISDPTGLVYKAGKKKEVDIVVKDGELFVFEVKSAPDWDDVDEFADKTELVRLQNPDKSVKGVFIAVGREENVRDECARRGLILIP